LEQLSIPDQDYSDLSPKGSVDEPVRQLVEEINQLEGFVTTSSCSGRIAVYLEGIPKSSRQDDGHDAPATATNGIASGGKGGGQWLYVSHDPLDLSKQVGEGDLKTLFGLPSGDSVEFPSSPKTVRFIHLKFEPLVSLLYFKAIHRTHVESSYFSGRVIKVSADSSRSCISSHRPCHKPSKHFLLH